MKQLLYILSALLLIGCGQSAKPAKSQSKQINKADFSADSAYQYIAAQTAFGPRTIGSDAHRQCVDYLANQLQCFGAEIELQTGEMPDYAGNIVPVTNIIGRYNPDASQRILLAAHYDSRPWADHDSDPDKHRSPIDGANDGASGVGVLLEIARQMQTAKTKIGLDIVFFDAEDMGAPEFYTGKEKENDWCLGSQLWADRHKSRVESRESRDESPTANYRFGIVLDMVGAGDAVFPYEYFSMQYAAEYVRQIWQTAAQLGYGRYFTTNVSYPITDDHYYVNTIANIPCVDIIHYVNPQGYGDSGFCQSWHTASDNMSVINHNTLDAVGTTVMTFLIGN